MTTTKPCIYRLDFASGHFYIGSSTNLDKRITAHRSRLKAGQDKFKAHAYDRRKHFDNQVSVTILKTCTASQLAKHETNYIRESIHDPKCLNRTVRVGAPMRGRTSTNETKLFKSVSMIGKNTVDGQIHRPTQVTFVSPEGQEHEVINIAEFARTHGLAQTSLNRVANGMQTHHMGWYVKGRLKTLTMVSPDGIDHKVAEHQLRRFVRSIGESKTHTKKWRNTSDNKGRCWYVKGLNTVFAFYNLNTKEFVDNVTFLPAFSEYSGINTSALDRLAYGRTKTTHNGWMLAWSDDPKVSIEPLSLENSHA